MGMGMGCLHRGQKIMAAARCKLQEGGATLSGPSCVPSHQEVQRGGRGEDLPTGDGVIRYDFTMGSPSGRQEDNLQCTAYGFDEDMPSGINDLGGLGQIFTDTHSGSSSGPPTEFYHLHQETPEGGKVKITVLGRPGGNSGLSDSGTSSDSDSDSDSNRNQGDNGSPPIVRRRSFFRD